MSVVGVLPSSITSVPYIIFHWYYMQNSRNFIFYSFLNKKVGKMKMMKISNTFFKEFHLSSELLSFIKKTMFSIFFKFKTNYLKIIYFHILFYFFFGFFGIISLINLFLFTKSLSFLILLAYIGF